MGRGDHFYGLHGLNVETYDVLQQLHSDRGEISALDGDVDFYVRHAARSGGPDLSRIGAVQQLGELPRGRGLVTIADLSPQLLGDIAR